MATVKTRIAPSPTGDMHLGTARTALFNYLFARASRGEFILRIDDTDLERNKEEHVDVILQTMEWLGLKPDTIFRQSGRTKRYTECCELLVSGGKATRLDNGAVALVWDNNWPRDWRDTLAGTVPITDTNIEQINSRLILSRGGDKLGQPTYQLATVVDDYDYDITHVIRGVDHTSNTAKQAAIWWAINDATKAAKPLPTFSHIGLINKDKKKLSKRDGAASLLGYKAGGYNPDAILNFMLRLGWGPRVDDKSTSIITKERAVELFVDGGSMRNSMANFDQAKLDSFDRKYKAMANALQK